MSPETGHLPVAHFLKFLKGCLTMTRATSIPGLALVVLLASTATAQQPKQPLKPQPGTLKSGDVAPVFELADADGENKVKLADLKGKPVVLVFGSCT